MAIERIVTTPTGDELPVYSDADLLTLYGDGRSPNALSLMTSWHPRPHSPRAPALLALWHEGAAEDRSGRAALVLRDRATRYGLGADVEPSVVTTSIGQGAIGELFVERVTNAKRTYSIRLVAVAERWLPYLEPRTKVGSAPATTDADLTGTEDDAAATAPPEPEPEGRTGGATCEHGDVSADVAVLAPAGTHSPVEFELTNAVATALLTQVIEIIATGAGAGPQLGRLQLDVEALEARLGTQVAYVDKLRRDLREAGDEITALRFERDGLRTRLRKAEHNLTVAMSADAQRIIDAEVTRQLDKLMRQAPNGEHSKRTASVA